MKNTLQFNGTIPQHYEDILTPFLFDSFSADLMERIDFSSAHKVLELASGTGSVTKQILTHLPLDGHLTATDLQASMLDVAKLHITAPNITWDIVDMTDIPYADETYDLIICQFGLMLVPDKLKALSEMQRVLKKGGRLVFSVWGNIEENTVWKISGIAIETFLGSNPMLQNPGPFAMSTENETLDLLRQSGFTITKANSVKKIGVAASAAIAAEGFIQGLPVFMAISQKDTALIVDIKQELELQLITQLGNNPLRSPLAAWVFETIK